MDWLAWALLLGFVVTAMRPVKQINWPSVNK